MPPEFEKLLNELITTARNLGYLVAMGQVSTEQYRLTDERLQALRGRLIELCQEEVHQ